MHVDDDPEIARLQKIWQSIPADDRPRVRGFVGDVPVFDEDIDGPLRDAGIKVTIVRRS